MPGLIKYCVYPTGANDAPAVDVTAHGGETEEIDWTKNRSSKSPYNFSFGRPGGNATNIWFDEDNETTTMGTATWTGDVPASQKIVLHVADPRLCGTSPTCFVKPNPGPICNAGAGDGTFGYSNLPRDFSKCAPPPSFGFEAHPGTSEFGNGVSVSGGSNIKSLTVDFQSYGCSDDGHWNTGDCATTPGETFGIPANGGDPAGITAHLYAVGANGSVGDSELTARRRPMSRSRTGRRRIRAARARTQASSAMLAASASIRSPS